MINAGVILSCPALDFLEARTDLDTARLLALDPSFDVEAALGHLEMIPRVCRGGADAGPIGELPQRARFHWLLSPRSTVIQLSPVPTGRARGPGKGLERLPDTLVRPAPEYGLRGGGPAIPRKRSSACSTPWCGGRSSSVAVAAPGVRAVHGLGGLTRIGNRPTSGAGRGAAGHASGDRGDTRATGGSRSCSPHSPLAL